jgi:YHS domain-containing protein
MEGLLSLLLIALFFYVMMRLGCGAHMIHGVHEGHQHHDDQVNHIDPVCKMEVDPKQGYGKMHKEHLYRFCSKDCLEKFDNDPVRYITKKRDHS